MSHRGYSLYRRGGGGAYYVAWTDGQGRRQTRKASANKTIAHEIGRALAGEADRVRAGVVDAAELKISEAAREPIENHVKAWEKNLKHLGRTARYVAMQATRVRRTLKDAAVGRLADLSAAKVQAALDAVAQSSSPQTANHYRTAVGMFARWCTVHGKLSINPLLAVRALSVAGKTFVRRPLTADELEALLYSTLTRSARTPFKNVDRAMYYRLMAYTGLRRGEAASLTPESFDLQEASVTIRAAYAKNRRQDVLPLRADLVELLRPWLAGKKPEKPVFEMGRWINLERLFRRDCKAAGIEPREGEVLGVHSLRRFFITAVVRAGGLAVGQDLARHSTPTLTKEYTDLTLRDRRKGLEGLPAATRPKVQIKKKRA